jgi:protocatechuate 3,4-dioxygenase beta subunit
LPLAPQLPLVARLRLGNQINDQRNPDSPRGGSSGVLSLKKENGILVGERDFILGKNIQGYE